jgi:protein O-GlcNAc transferase
MPAPGIARQAMTLWQNGKHAEAEAICHAALAEEPRDTDVLVALAFIASQTGRMPAAIAHLQRAHALEPHKAGIVFNLGVLLAQQERLVEAEECYRQAVKLAPGSVEALTNLGSTLQRLRRPRDAIEYLREALRLRPRDPVATAQLGFALLEAGDAAGGAEQLRFAARASPRQSAIHYNLGNALCELGDLDGAISSYRAALAIDPGHVDAHYNLANTLRDSGRVTAAIDSYRAALRIQPRHLAALNNLGAALRGSGAPAEALACYERVLEIEPNDPMVHLNIGQALVDLKKELGAVGYLQRAIELKPDYVDAMYALGNALLALQRHDEAAAAYQQALTLAPSHAASAEGLLRSRLEQWDWAAVAPMLERVRALADGRHPLPPYTFLLLSNDPQEQLFAASTVAARLLLEIPKELREPPAASTRHPSRSRIPPRPVRLAYVSPDLHDHAVGNSLVEILEHHDRRDFFVIGVSIGARRDAPVTRRITAACDSFIDAASWSTQAIVGKLRELDIDVAVDLAGYTHDSRPGILVHRPAAVQVNYLGYAGSMGAPWIDYILADKFVVPDELAVNYSEKIARLPHCFLPSDTLPQMLPESHRSAEGLPANAVVLCCFNTPLRISAAIVDVWARLLRTVEGTVLWLKRPASAAAHRHLLDFMRERGVAEDRIVFANHAPSRDSHLSRQQLADLYLDSFPYTSHSTARDALAVGLPLLTCVGRTFAARVAGSVLHTLGMPQLIASDLAAYERMAVALASDRGALRTLRAELRQKLPTSPLLDMRQLTGSLEQAFQKMVEIQRSGSAPTSFDVA